jgi:hypothetical protein
LSPHRPHSTSNKGAGPETSRLRTEIIVWPLILIVAAVPDI